MQAAQQNVALDWDNKPNPYRTFADYPKTALPTTILDASVPTLELLSDGVAALPASQVQPPQNLKTLGSWLYLANGITIEKGVGSRRYSLRTCPSSGALFPFEVYVAAFAIDGLEPGLYHYSVREFSLRKLRDGAARAPAPQARPPRPGLPQDRAGGAAGLDQLLAQRLALPPARLPLRAARRRPPRAEPRLRRPPPSASRRRRGSA